MWSHFSFPPLGGAQCLPENPGGRIKMSKGSKATLTVNLSLRNVLQFELVGLLGYIVASNLMLSEMEMIYY